MRLLPHKSIWIFLLLIFSLFTRADNLPGYIHILDIPAENMYLKVIAYYDYSQDIFQKTELKRNELFQVEEAVITSTSGEVVSNVYSYDDNGYQTSMITYLYKNENWHPQKESEYLFDDKGRQVMSAEYEYTNTIKSGVGEKWIKVFNENGLCTDYETYTWENGAWNSFMRKETSFNAKGNLSGIRTKYSSGEMSANVIFMYNAISGFLERETYQKWENGSFVNSFSMLYSYDSSERITRLAMQSYEENTWKTFEERIFSYDDNKTTVTRHVFSDDGEKTSETSFTSGADHAIVTNSDGSTWKHTYSNGYALSKQITPNDWKDVVRYDYTNNDDFINTFEVYSDNDKKTYRLRWYLDEEFPDELVFAREYFQNSGNVEVEKKIIFSFSEDISAIEEIPDIIKFNIYPNPVINFITIESTETFNNADYFIYNTLGRLVTRGKLHNSTQQIDLSNLPSGQYIFNTQLNGNLYSMILLKK